MAALPGRSLPAKTGKLMGPAYRSFWGGLAVSACLGPGCGEELVPEPMPTARVAGRVHAGGRPVRGGWVEFLPVDGTVGRLRSAPIGPDGSFTEGRVAVGTQAIRLVDPTAAGPLPGGRLFQQRYLIRRRVGAQGDDRLDIDLQDEAIRIFRPRAGRGR
jgi:hypothetical protein